MARHLLHTIQETKTNMKTQGIYILESTETGKKYLGSSMDLEKRKKDHFNRLISNRHRNKGLQESYNEFGPNSIEFKVVEKFKGSREELYILEQSYLDSVKEEDKGEYFNISYNVFGGGSEALETPCYILNLKGEILEEHKSLSDATSSELLNYKSDTVVNYNTDTVRRGLYRVVTKDFYHDSLDEIMLWDRESAVEKEMRLERERIEAIEHKRVIDTFTFTYKGDKYETFDKEEAGRIIGRTEERVRQLLSSNSPNVYEMKYNIKRHIPGEVIIPLKTRDLPKGVIRTGKKFSSHLRVKGVIVYSSPTYDLEYCKRFTELAYENSELFNNRKQYKALIEGLLNKEGVN